MANVIIKNKQINSGFVESLQGALEKAKVAFDSVKRDPDHLPRVVVKTTDKTAVAQIASKVIKQFQ
jgi:hypothetical protein